MSDEHHGDHGIDHHERAENMKKFRTVLGALGAILIFYWWVSAPSWVAYDPNDIMRHWGKWAGIVGLMIYIYLFISLWRRGQKEH